jgi:hypothetical protein
MKMKMKMKSELLMMSLVCLGSMIRNTAAEGILASVGIAAAERTWRFGLASILVQAQIN